MGLFSGKKKEEERIEEITPALKARLDEFAEKGNRFEDDLILRIIPKLQYSC